MLYNPSTEWFKDAKYGLFVHFLPGDETVFPLKVNEFDTAAFADDCELAGAGYVIFTIGQNSGYYNAPNAAYDRYTGYCPGERTASRDLIDDLHKALNRKGIKLMLYASALAPKEDKHAAFRLGCTEKYNGRTNDWIITETFRQRWAEVLEEYSVRYGGKVAGWWIDGSYEWASFDERTAEAYSKALKSGNAASVVCFNPGAGVMIKVSDYDDYAAGEYNNFLAPECTDRWVDGIQWHQLSYITQTWGKGELGYTAERLADHIRRMNANGGVVTMDVPLDETSIGDRIRPDALEQLIAIKQACR